MVTGPALLVIFVVSVALLLALIIRFRINPFLALVSTAIATAFLVRMPVAEIGPVISKGFGNTLAGIGIVIGLGIILGKLLAEANATDQIAHAMLDRVGRKRAPLAVNLTGYLVSIPVFMDAGFVILMPLVRQISRRAGTPLIALVCALCAGMITSHAMVLPTPGPLAVAGNMAANAGVFLLYSIVVSVPGAVVGGLLYGRFLRSRGPAGNTPAMNEVADAAEPAPRTGGSSARARPSAGLSLLVLVFPILLILVGNILGLVLPTDSVAAQALAFAGDKNVALLLGVLLAAVTLKKYLKRSIGELIVEAADSAGLILLVTGAGGAFGNVINTSGIGQTIVETMTHWNLSLLVLSFTLSLILRAAQGSTTVALITTSSIVGPMTASLGASPVLVGLAICAGGVGLSLPNDSGFWVISRFAGLSVTDTIKAWSVGATIAGIVAFLMVVLLSTLVGLAPGL
ncbi:MAG TPA: gluconate:H+ symporter [Opitutaceae bacterium]